LAQFAFSKLFLIAAYRKTNQSAAFEKAGGGKQHYTQSQQIFS